MSEEYIGGAMSEEYEEVRDRSNKLVMRLEAFESREVDEIDMKWLIGEVCHLRGAYITNSFRLRDERERAEKAEAEVTRLVLEVAAVRASREKIAEQRDRARAIILKYRFTPLCAPGPTNEEVDAALADEPLSSVGMSNEVKRENWMIGIDDKSSTKK